MPEDWEVELGVPECEDAKDCVEFEAKEGGLDIAAMFATEEAIPQELLK